MRFSKRMIWISYFWVIKRSNGYTYIHFQPFIIINIQMIKSIMVYLLFSRVMEFLIVQFCYANCHLSSLSLYLHFHSNTLLYRQERITRTYYIFTISAPFALLVLSDKIKQQRLIDCYPIVSRRIIKECRFLVYYF